jgi:hypothetical protein
MNRKIIYIIICIILLILLTRYTKEYYDVNLTMKGYNLDPLFIQVPEKPSIYKGFIDYGNQRIQELCPNSQQKLSKKCETRADCGPAEVCIHDGVTSYCQCSISNDCIESGVC